MARTNGTARTNGKPPIHRGLTIGELIRRKRRADGCTQEQVAELIDVHQSSVAKWERGDQPRPEKLPAIAKYLGIEFRELLGVYHDAPDAQITPLPEPAASSDTAGLAKELQALTRAVRTLAKAVADMAAVQA